MSVKNVRKYLAPFGLDSRIMEFSQSSATVDEAALAVGCEPARIAKTMSFLQKDGPILIVIAGDARVENKKYKVIFHQKAKMIPFEDVESYIGHPPGGVCPFDLPPGVKVYLDISLKRFSEIYPAAGTANSAVRLSCDELEKSTGCIEWVDICKDWQDN